LLSILLLSGGCGTVASISRNDFYPNIVYGGVRRDLQPPGTDVIGPNLPSLLDLPLSAVADTLAVPYTIPRSVYNSCHPKDAPPPYAGFDPESWLTPHIAR
jgi:uncharacterized protein YceK